MATRNTGRFYQYFSTVTANLGLFHLGIITGWASPMFATLDSGAMHDVSEEHRSIHTKFIIALPTLSAALSSIFSGWLADTFGRTNVMIMTGLPTILSWLMQILVPRILMLYICRFIQGMVMGISSTIVPIYIGEIADPTIRGMLASTITIFIIAGQTLMYGLSAFENYNVLHVPGLICGILMTFVTMLIPESPAYLMTANKPEKAIESLKTLRGRDYDTGEEIRLLEEESKRSRDELSLGQILSIRANRISLALGIAIIFFRQFSGISIIVHYVERIFRGVSPNVSPIPIIVVNGLISIAVSFVSVFLFDVVGRKILHIISSVGMTLAYASLASDFVLLTRSTSLFAFVAVSSIFLYIQSYNIGWGPGSWLLMSELFSLEVKKIASSATTVVNFLLAFVTIVGFPMLVETFGNAAAFYTLATACFCSLLFITIAVPETKSKTLYQIQQELETGK